MKLRPRFHFLGTFLLLYRVERFCCASVHGHLHRPFRKIVKGTEESADHFDNLGNNRKHGNLVISLSLASRLHLAATLVISALFAPFKSGMMLVWYEKHFLLDCSGVLPPTCEYILNHFIPSSQSIRS